MKIEKKYGSKLFSKKKTRKKGKYKVAFAF